MTRFIELQGQLTLACRVHQVVSTITGGGYSPGLLAVTLQTAVAALRKARKSELLDRNMLCIVGGRLTHYGGSCSSVSRLSASLRPRVAGLTALTPAARELERSYGDRSRCLDAVQISALSDDC